MLRDTDETIHEPDPGSTASGPTVRDDTILVVDDDDAVRDIVAEMLRAAGWRVLCATDGEDALDAAEHHSRPIGAVVSDVRMPRLSGVGLAHQLRSWYPGIRFLLMSGYPESHDVLAAESERRTVYLPKPFTAQQLVTALEALLDD